MDKLTKLIRIFCRDEFDLHANGALGDDILGDAYEYLMRQFAADSGKSKGQFYTPAEASRVLASLVGLDEIQSRPECWTICDPACGSGSLLIRSAATASGKVSIYGQEKDVSTAGLAKMNCVIHGIATADIRTGNTFSEPRFFEPRSNDEELMRFDFIVINPPFSYKSWQNGYRDYGRQEGWDAKPPAKNGDYAWLLHVIKSMKSTGRAAVIMPLGVLFRGNAEETLRKAIVEKGLLEGIVAFPPNIFYGTSIPACALILSKGDAEAREGVFMIDASHGFEKDDDNNRLRERDVRKIIDAYKGRLEEPHYSRFVPLSEIAAKGFNLNLPRYIDAGHREDVQNIEAHLHGGIPEGDIDDLAPYWTAFPGLRKALFAPLRDGFFSLRPALGDVRSAIAADSDFAAYGNRVRAAFDVWRDGVKDALYGIEKGVTVPKAFIASLGDAILRDFADLTLLDRYDAYQTLLSYWNETMCDDLYILAQDGFEAGREIATIKKEIKHKNGTVDKKEIGWEGRLIPRAILDRVCFADEVAEIEAARAAAETAKAAVNEYFESETEEDGALVDYVKKGKGEEPKPDAKKLSDDFKQMKKAKVQDESFGKIAEYFRLEDERKKADKQVDALESALEAKERTKYPALTLDEVKRLVIEEKWLASVWGAIDETYRRVSSHLAERVGELAVRYGRTLGDLERELKGNEAAVEAHLKAMGYGLITMRQGAMQDLLTGKKRLPGFTGEWEERKIGTMLSIGHGKDYKRLQSGEVPVYGTGGYMCSVADFLYDGPTVCVGRKGTIDKPFYHEGKIWTVDTLFYTHSFVNSDPKFIYYTFLRVDWLSLNTASGVPSLTSKAIENLRIRVPPTVAEQSAIAAVLSDMDAEIAALEAKTEKMRAVKAGMLQELLTGRKRI